MAAKQRSRKIHERETLFALNEFEYPRDKAEADRIAYCEECSEVRQENGRWLVFVVCKMSECTHEHHKDEIWRA